jgi:hypothetical protein
MFLLLVETLERCDLEGNFSFMVLLDNLIACRLGSCLIYFYRYWN